MRRLLLALIVLTFSSLGFTKHPAPKPPKSKLPAPKHVLLKPLLTPITRSELLAGLDSVYILEKNRPQDHVDQSYRGAVTSFITVAPVEVGGYVGNASVWFDGPKVVDVEFQLPCRFDRKKRGAGTWQRSTIEDFYKLEHEIEKEIGLASLNAGSSVQYLNANKSPVLIARFDQVQEHLSVTALPSGPSGKD